MINWLECDGIEFELSFDSRQILKDEFRCLAFVDHTVRELNHLQLVHILVKIWILVKQLLILWVQRLSGS